MGSVKVFVLLCVAGVAVGDKGPTGIQPHHITGAGGYDSFGQNHAPQPVYDSKGKGYAAPHAPAPSHGPPAPSYGPPVPSYGPPKGNIPVVYYPIERPKSDDKGYFKSFEKKMKEYGDKFTKFMKDSIGYGEDYDYYTAPAPGYGPPADSYGPPPTDSYGPPPTDHYGPPAPVVVDYHYDYEEEKDKGIVDKMKDYYSKFAKEMEKASNKMKEMFGYGDYDYDYEVVEVPAPAYGAPAPAYGAPAPAYGAPAPAPAYGAPAPAPAYGAPAPHHEPAVVYQQISRPKEPKAEKGSFFKSSKAPKRRPVKKPRPGPYHPAPQPSYHAPAAPVHHAPVHHAPVHHAPVHPAPVHHAPVHPAKAAPVHHAKAAPVHHVPVSPVHHAPTYPAQPSEYGPPKTHDITHGQVAAPVKAKGGHAHHTAPAPSSGVSSYTSH